MIVSFYFSKWPEASALPNKSAIGVAEFLYKCTSQDVSNYNVCNYNVYNYITMFVIIIINIVKSIILYGFYYDNSVKTYNI